jgi:two-component system, NtrC family, response regulator AtoC
VTAVQSCMILAVPEAPRPTKGETTESLELPSGAGDLRLLVSSPGGGDQSHTLAGKTRVILGRGKECDVVVDDPAVSRRHVAIHLLGFPFLEDLGSRNGTVLSGRTLHKGDRAPLPIGTSFALGAATVVLQRRSAIDRAPEGAVVEDPAMRAAYELLDVIGPSPLSVLVLGETGTGKEVFAQAIHSRSPRASRTFLPINCAALSETLLESELFGHEKGAFTGATHAKTGLFEAASGGTAFLDEIGELAMTTQAKLLRVLESGEVTPIGSVKPRRIDVRFVAATNRDLGSLVEAGRFRGDLFYRLNGFTVTLPPLRERPADILPLALTFAARAAARLDRSAPTFTDSAADALRRHTWPGNVRELRNVVERAVSTCRGSASLLVEHLAIVPARADAVGPARTEAGVLPDAVGSFEKERILEALRRTSFNQTEAAKALGISRRTLINKIIAHGIPRPRKGG